VLVNPNWKNLGQILKMQISSIFSVKGAKSRLRRISTSSMSIFALLILLMLSLTGTLQFSLFVDRSNQINPLVDPGCMGRCLQYMADSHGGSNETFCSSVAETRGVGQKVVSFSWFGERDSRYFRGIGINLYRLWKYYPSWVMRVYLDPVVSEPRALQDLCALSCTSQSFDLCSVRSLPRYGDISSMFGMVWRFLPMADPYVDIMVSRDLDSRLSSREVAAVNDWMSSGLPFHAMRDHNQHENPILGGMWGSRKTESNSKLLTSLVDTLITTMNSSWTKGYDQDLLEQHVWPLVKNVTVVHDAYLCTRYRAPHTRPWPTRRNIGTWNFVGSAGSSIERECPPECRPKNHQDWTTC